MIDENLIYNGYGNQNSNANFPELNWDNNNKNFNVTSDKYTKFMASNFIPVSTSKKYLQTVEAKATNLNARYYIGFAGYDVDKKFIDWINVGYTLNTLTTLTKDLKNGDTVVYLNDLTNFMTTGASTSFGLIFWNYKDSTGYTYPPQTYSRNAYRDIFDMSGINKVNKTITLKAPWNKGTFKAGTQLSQLNGTNFYGTYNYGVIINSVLPSNWTKFSNTITGIWNPSSYRDSKVFRPATKYIRFITLNNYNSQANSTLYLRNIVFKEIK